MGLSDSPTSVGEQRGADGELTAQTREPSVAVPPSFSSREVVKPEVQTLTLDHVLDENGAVGDILLNGEGLVVRAT